MRHEARGSDHAGKALPRPQSGPLAVALLAAGAMLFALAATAALPSAAAAQAPQAFWTKCDGGPEDLPCSITRGVAADPNLPGHVYVGDQNNRRVIEFDAWGVPVRTWGWDVVASGPGDDSSPPENQFEVCVPAEGDVCKAGTTGTGPGQFGGGAGLGVAIDASGDVYVSDWGNARVQKFSSEGEFLLMWGGGVNQGPGSPGNVCTAQHIADGDSCGAGSEGTGQGQFSWEIQVGDYVAVGPGTEETVYIGDKDRIQEFTPDGTYKGEIALPGEFVQSLAADTAGNLYATLVLPPGHSSKPNVRKLSPTGSSICTLEVNNPRAVAVDAAGNAHVVDRKASSSEVLQFDPGCGKVDLDPGGPGFGWGAGELNQPTGIAAGSACHLEPGAANIYLSDGTTPGPLRAYGPNPDNVDDCPPPLRAPVIGAQFAVSVGTEEALLRAQINPRFWEDTAYYLEYGTSECAASEGACSQRKPLEGETLLGAGVIEAPVTIPGVFLAGLEPGTTYHYRFVAQSSGGGPVYGVDPDGEGPKEASFEDGEEGTFTTYEPPRPPKTDCANQPFRGGASAALANCRAYEMVSPVDKNGGDIESLTNFSTGTARAEHEQSAGDGEALTYSSKTAFCEGVSAPVANQYLAHREAGVGWTCEAISPPREGATFRGQPSESEYKAFSDDLSQAWLIHDSEPPLGGCAPPQSFGVYWRDNEAGGYAPLHCRVISPSEQQRLHPELQGISADGERAVFRAPAQLTDDAPPLSVPPDAGAPGTPDHLYESSRDGELRFVSVLPSGAACSNETTKRKSSAGSPTGSNDNRSNNVRHALSGDGRRLYWSCQTTSGSNPDLYLRTDPNPDLKGDETVVLVSTSAVFLTASATDGSTALFTSGGALKAYDAETATTTTIAGGVPANSALLGASEDAGRAYFASTQALTGGQENSEGDVAQAAKPNLYLYEAGEGGPELTFVATLASKDMATGVDSPLNLRPFSRLARVSPDGLHAAFVSSAPLTGYDNTDLKSGEADAEVFLYDAAAGKLRCVSCNPSGARPAGRNIGEGGVGKLWAAARLPGWHTQFHPTRALSDSGDRLFFESFEALALRDTNGRQDVYEWTRAGGRAQCEAIGADLYSPSAGGCISLISSGQSPTDSEFLDADRDGSNVFFKTGESLLAQDPASIDIYVARVGGGLPGPPAPPSPCGGDACQPDPVAPAFPATSSQVFRGPGNPAFAQKPNCGRISKQARRKLAAAKRAARKGQAKRARKLRKRVKALKRRARHCKRRAAR